MAVMIPGVHSVDDFNWSGGEVQLFNLLQQLPDDYVVFHSTNWNEKRRREELGRREYVEWGEADFTIFHPEKGIIVFEVKDGEISYTNEAGWRQTNRQNRTSVSTDPMAQAEKSKYHFLRLIQRQFGGKSPYSLCSAVWFTSGDRTCVKGDLPQNYKDEIVLWANDLLSVESALMAISRVYTYYDTRAVTQTTELTEKIISILSPEFGAFKSIRTQRMETQALFLRMTREQAYLLDYLDEQQVAAIHGGAGTGKTMLAIQKAQRLANPDKVLVLCFNAHLKEYLETNYGTEYIKFTNLDSLVLGKNWRSLPVGPGNASLKDEMILDYLLDWTNNDMPYKHIIVDEGQDFSNDHLQALNEVAHEINGCFYVFYDKFQFVQGFHFPDWIQNVDCRLVLTRNCRNTREIALTSSRPIGIDENKIKMRIEGNSSSKPNLFFVSTKEELKAHLVKLVQKYVRAKIPKENIVVLSVKAQNRSVLRPEDYFLATGYELSEDRVQGKIFFTTARKFKGLESEVIICIDVDRDTFKDDLQRNVFYVGTSRAQTFLEIISIQPSADEIDDFASTLVGEEIRKPKTAAVIRDALKVKIGTTNDLES